MKTRKQKLQLINELTKQCQVLAFLNQTSYIVYQYDDKIDFCSEPEYRLVFEPLKAKKLMTFTPVEPTDFESVVKIAEYKAKINGLRPEIIEFQKDKFTYKWHQPN